MKEKFKKQLLVEGNDDQHVVWALCTKHNITENFDVVDCGGIDTLLNKELSLRLTTKPEAIGIILDADTDLASRWNSVVAILTKAGFTLPQQPSLDGTIVKSNNTTIGIWLMPDNSTSGMIEDFLRFLIPPNDKLLSIADSTLTDIEQKNVSLHKPIHRSKALLHTWLAWQSDPGTPMGWAITKKYLSNDGDVTCQKFIDWLKNTFA